MSHRIPNVHFITYGSGPFREAARNLASSAEQVGFKTACAYDLSILTNSEFAHRNAEVLASTRGAGFWLWKPYLILRRLREIKKDEILIYSDAGRTPYYQFQSLPKTLIEFIQSTPQKLLTGTAIGHLGSVQTWSKSDCILILDATNTSIPQKPMIQTTWSAWTRSEFAFHFLESWLSYCEDPRCLTDTPNTLGINNSPSFRDHRHDQSICSILTYKEKAQFLDFSDRWSYKLLSKIPNSGVSNLFFKRIQNCNDLLHRENPLLIAREVARLKITHYF
jgi:hypothetical protein